MLRVPIDARKNWQTMANDYGFHFHTMHGQPYWDETAYYQFNLNQIERDLESPTEDIHQMCLQVVDKVVKDEELLKKFAIPEEYWDAIALSWKAQEPSLYSRLDFVYDGKNPAKLLENNADTPTSLYESGFWQWLWLESNVDNNKLSKKADQFNSLQEKLVNRFKVIADYYRINYLHFACCKDTDEDRGTVQYLQDCAKEAGLDDYFVYIEDIGLAEDGKLSDLENQVISHCFKLYPWEFMQREEFGPHAINSDTSWIEPIWKTILSNKALLPMLWREFKGHPNLLPAFFESDIAGMQAQSEIKKWVKKPLYSREGANIEILENGKISLSSAGPYGEEGFIYQAHTTLPKFAESYTLIGSWLVGDEAAGISVREDSSPITQDLSRYMPHIIL
jgi:glutathionylspermidine synthase